MNYLTRRKQSSIFSIGFVFTLTLDVITTAFELTFIKETYEKNPIAYYLIQNFNIVSGLMISVLVELIFWVLFYIGLKIHLLIISIKVKNELNISNTSGIIVLLIVFVFHIKGVINNLGVLFALL